MRARWMALHDSLWRSITTLTADRQFEVARNSDEALKRFDTAVTLVAYLATKTGDRDEKDRIYAALIRAAGGNAEWRELATALVWLGLWPGLDALYGRRQRDFIGRPDELVAEIGFILTTLIERIDLARVNRLAATMVRNVERDVCEACRRRRAEEAHTVDVDDRTATGPDENLRSRPTIENRALPVDAGDIAAVRSWLADLVRGDANLVIGAALYGFDLHELADALDIGHEAARKRFQRAIKRIRDRLEKMP